MVQEFHVIRCFSCETFQVHQVKKSKKWNCKLCGAKQSVRKEYGRGTGADCRRHVQKLNMMRGTLDSAPPACEDSEEEWQESTEDATAAQYDYTDDGLQHSKWEKFVASSDLKPDDKDPSDSEDAQFTTDKNRFQQKKRKGKRQGERLQFQMCLLGHHLSRPASQIGSFQQLNKRVVQCLREKEVILRTLHTTFRTKVRTRASQRATQNLKPQGTQHGNSYIQHRHVTYSSHIQHM
ncbi:MRN complex-interacting protein-like isoform X2 [Branchiostoma lanceolatum]|uniref:MRN complex-interacting protein-like isoform X2 n=1 Tax=Branchiostoma lanceolatum TaxID=7740 RepID=UPI003453E4E8